MALAQDLADLVQRRRHAILVARLHHDRRDQRGAAAERPAAEQLARDTRQVLEYRPFDPLSMFAEPSMLVDQLWRIAGREWDLMSLDRDWLSELRAIQP